MLAEHGVLRERLEVLPAAQGTDPAQGGVVDSQVGAVALTEEGTFHVGRLELAPGTHQFAVRGDHCLAHVEAAAAALAVAGDHGDVVRAGGVEQALEARPVQGD
jgi:hypothetical protein